MGPSYSPHPRRQGADRSSESQPFLNWDPESRNGTPFKTASGFAGLHIIALPTGKRELLAMSQSELGDALGITYQQVQKNEMGTNRISASRLQQISHILQVPVAFFFEGVPNASAPHGPRGSQLSIAQIDDFISDPKGLRLIRAFMRIGNAELRRKIVILVQEIADDKTRAGR
jgi:transcriptional regulator with XRE-family HTH domain